MKRSAPFRRTRGFSSALLAWLFIAPALLGFVLFYLFPTLRAIAMSLTSWNLLSPARYIGLENYRTLATDEQFWKSIRVTVLYVLYNIPLQTFLALWLAVLLDRHGRSVLCGPWS